MIKDPNRGRNVTLFVFLAVSLMNFTKLITMLNATEQKSSIVNNSKQNNKAKEVFFSKTTRFNKSNFYKVFINLSYMDFSFLKLFHKNKECEEKAVRGLHIFHKQKVYFLTDD